MSEQQPQPQQQQIKIQDMIPGGEYANAMQVGHNKEEFLLTFMNIIGAGGRVTGKIITSPGHFKRMVRAMEDNLKKYEASFGIIAEAQSPNQEIGFKADQN